MILSHDQSDGMILSHDQSDGMIMTSQMAWHDMA